MFPRFAHPGVALSRHYTRATEPVPDVVWRTSCMWLLGGKTSAVVRRRVRRRGAVHSAPGVTGSDQSLDAVSLLAFAVEASDADDPGCSSGGIRCAERPFERGGDGRIRLGPGTTTPR